MTVHIMIAAPGAGKSKLAKELRTRGLTEIYSADSYFEQWEGCWETEKVVYKFDPSKLGEAHAKCLRDFSLDLVQSRKDREDPWELDYIIDNTNSSLVEIAPYYSLARAYGHKVIFHRFLANRHVLEHEYFPRNVHGVPLHAVMAIGQRVWELEFPKFWEFELVEHGMTKGT